MFSALRLPSLAAALLLAAGCADHDDGPIPPTPPEDFDDAFDEDPIRGDPSDIEGAEIGDEQMDNARAVEPGPAEIEVQTARPWPR